MTAPSEFNRRSILAAVACATGVLVSIGPIVASTFGIFMASFTHTYGWSRTAFSVAVLICALAGALFTPVAGWAVDRYGARRVMLPAVALFGIAIGSVALVQQSIWQLYLLYGVVGIAAGFQNMVAYSKVISQWFHRHRGLVLSLVSTCYGIAYAFIPKVVQPLIATHGWRAGYEFLGALVLVTLVVLIPFLRLPPEAVTACSRVTVADASAATAARSPAFWIIAVVLVLGVTALIGTVAHLFPMLLDRGFQPRFATTVLSVFALGGIAGQLSYGALVDRINTPKIALPFFTASFLGLTLIHYAVTPGLLLLGGALMGVGQGSELGLAAYFVGRYFGLRSLGQIYGYIYAGATVASGVGPLLMGYAFDHLHSYAPMLLLFQIGLLLAVIGIAVLPAYVFPARRATPA